MTSDDTPSSYFGMPIERNPFLPPTSFAFKQYDHRGEPYFTICNFEETPAPVAKQLGDTVSYDTSYHLKSAYTLDASLLSDSHLDMNEEIVRAQQTRLRNQERKLFEDIALSGQPGRSPWSNGTTCVAPEATALTAEKMIAAMEEMAEKIVESDAKLYAALLAAGIEIRVSDIIYKDTPVDGTVLFVPTSKKKALQKAHEKRAKEVHLTRAATYGSMWGMGAVS